MGEKRLAKMGKRRRQTYKNTFIAQRSCKLDTVTGQGKMVLVREKSGKSGNFDFSSLWVHYKCSFQGQKITLSAGGKGCSSFPHNPF